MGLAPCAPARHAASPGYGRLALFAASMLTVLVALVSPVDELSTDVMFVHMIQHVLLLDVVPILFILEPHQGAAAAGHAAPDDDRGARRLRRPPGVRGVPLHRHDGALARPADVRPGARAQRRSTCSSTSASSPPACSTGGTCSRRSARAWHSAAWARSSTWRSPSSSSACSASSSRSRRTRSTPGIRTTPHYWGLTARVDQNLAGVVMALEQSIIMGTALVYDRLQDAERQREGGPARGALRGRLAGFGAALRSAYLGPLSRASVPGGRGPCPDGVHGPRYAAEGGP